MRERIWKERFPWMLGQVRKQVERKKLKLEQVIEDLKGLASGKRCPDWECTLCERLFPKMDEFDCPDVAYNKNDIRSLATYLRRKLTEDLKKEKK